MARSALGAFRPTPQGILAAESDFTPARALLDHRQVRFAQRLLARPQDGGGPEEIIERDAAVSARLQAAAGTRRGESMSPRPGARTGPSPRVLPSVRGARHLRRPGTGGTERPSGPIGPGSTAEGWGRRALGRPPVVRQAGTST